MTNATPVHVSNNATLSRTFYYIDSDVHAVYAFDYDKESGELTNRRVAIDYAADPALAVRYPGAIFYMLYADP